MLIIVVGVCWLALPVGAVDSGQERSSLELLGRMAKALSEREYEGTLVYLNGHQLSTLRIAHRIDGGQTRESLLALSGPIRAVARGHQSVTCVLPDARAISVPRHPASAATLHSGALDIERLRSHYLIHLLGRSRIAGRDTRVVGIIPRDDLRYGYRFFVDEETGLPLKTDLMDSAAIPIEQVMFTEIEFLEEADKQALVSTPERTRPVAALSAQTATSTTPADPSKIVDAAPWHFTALPAGYRLVAADPPRAQAEAQVEGGRRWFMISDGLSTVSVYVEPDQEHGFTGYKRVGAVHAAGRLVDGHQVTVVGEAPLPTVQAIADALRTQP
ncbi:MucB/RseB C-terminal domain-containing protein [Halochromatium salexigens]|uniref:MucB/RseB C-terminal domain-containing protein n=1 Tax=Halochromatium salexigens TaxID=49447 RepID=UPI001F5D8F46|nr:MucB/RseB C-terminal domain-containing protein [Halochromatium salexigens]